MVTFDICEIFFNYYFSYVQDYKATLAGSKKSSLPQWWNMQTQGFPYLGDWGTPLLPAKNLFILSHLPPTQKNPSTKSQFCTHYITIFKLQPHKNHIFSCSHYSFSFFLLISYSLDT